MKAFQKYLLLIPVFSFLISGCLPDPIDIDVKPAPPKLVISSQILGNTGIIVALTRSYSPLDTGGTQDTLGNDFINQILVSNARVTVNSPNGTDTLYMIAPGLYANPFIPLTDLSSYTITAIDDSISETITASTIMQPYVPFDTVYPYIIRNSNDTTIHFHYELTDNTAQENYYVVNFVKKSANAGLLDINSIFSQGRNQSLSGFDLLDDQAFSNGKVTRDLLLTDIGQHDSVAAVVSQISKGYYEFLTAYKRSGSIFNQLTGEPINFPSNVNNGFGYFTLNRRDVLLFDLNLY